MGNEFDFPASSSRKISSIPPVAWIAGGVAAFVALGTLCVSAGVGFSLLARPIDAKLPVIAKKDNSAPPVAQEMVTRANFNEMRQTLAEAEEVLGPARHDSQGFGLDTVSWRSKNGRCIISATYEGNFLKHKTIIGD